MPVKTVIDHQARLVRHEVEGILTFDEVAMVIRDLYANPQFDTGMDVLMEITPGATSGLTSVEVIKVVDIFREIGNRRGIGRTVAVTPADADFGILRVLAYRLKGGTRPMQVFKTCQEALAWLQR